MRVKPSPLTIGKIILHAPAKMLPPLKILSGVGRGTINRPTPNTATLKKWLTQLSGFGSRPESKAIGPRA